VSVVSTGGKRQQPPPFHKKKAVQQVSKDRLVVVVVEARKHWFRFKFNCILQVQDRRIFVVCRAPK
jgi:methyl coenzyme M reductase subunit C